MATASVTRPDLPARPSGQPSYRAELASTLWVVTVAGLIASLAIGVMLRVGMLVLRLVSDPQVSGLVSDDGFEIGRVTVAGTFNLFMLGGGLGYIGAAAYLAVAPWLMGPPWARVATVGVAAMVIGGAVLIHRDGVDFTALDTRAAVVIFLLVPLGSGLVIVPVTRAVAGRVGRWPAWLPLLAVGYPVSLLALAVVALVVAVLLPIRRALLARIWARPWARRLTRAAFAAIPVVGAAALAADLHDLADLLGV